LTKPIYLFCYNPKANNHRKFTRAEPIVNEINNKDTENKTENYSQNSQVFEIDDLLT